MLEEPEMTQKQKLQRIIELQNKAKKLRAEAIECLQEADTLTAYGIKENCGRCKFIIDGKAYQFVHRSTQLDTGNTNWLEEDLYTKIVAD